MRYSISIAVLNNLELTRKCLDQIEANSGSDYELIISDNASTDGTAEFLAEFASNHPNCRVITYPYNTGFGYPHNQALRLARGEFFVVLNNDIFIHEKGWLEKLKKCFLDNLKLALVGFAGNHTCLTDDGTGSIDPQKLEYVEASCLMIPRMLALRYGLFSREYELAYYEDTDLSLRYRQIGFDIELVPCVHDHVNNATAFNIDQGLLKRAKETNKKTFLKRWSGYLQNRSFTSKILVRAVSTDPTLLLQTTPVLRMLKEEQALVQFDLVTNRPEIFLGNPAVTRCFTPDLPFDALEYDRLVAFDFAAISSALPVPLSLAEQAAVHLDELQPLLYPGENEKKTAAMLLPDGKDYVAVDAKLIEDTAFDVVGLLSDRGVCVVVCDSAGHDVVVRLPGGDHRVDIAGAAAVLARSLFFVGGVGLLSLVASSQRVPSLIVVGHGYTAWTAGLDLSCTCCLDDGFDEADFAKACAEVAARDFSRNVSLLQSTLLKCAYRCDGILDYYAGDVDARVGEYLRMVNLYSRSLNQAREALAMIHGSFSWRITAPLRRLHQFITNR